MTRLTSTALVGLLALCPSIAMAQDADLVLRDGQILTVDADFSTAESIAVLDGRILALGEDADMAGHIGANTQVIALNGKTVIPGLIDNHLHFIRSVWNYQAELRLDGVTSRAEALEMLKAHALEVEPGAWITVMGGWTPDQFRDDRGPLTLAELDAVAPDNPVFMMRSYSEGYANSTAFAAIGQDSNGSVQVTGRDGLAPFITAVSWRNKSSSPEAILAYMAELNRTGLTALYDVGRPSEGNLAPLAELAAEQALPLRVYHSLRDRATDEASAEEAMALISATKPLTKDAQYGLLGLGEHIYGPVADNPMHRGDWPDEDWQPFAQIARIAAEHGWPIHEHVMSQSTAVQFLDLVEEISKDVPHLPELRWTFAHANGMQDEDIARAADLGIALGVHSQARMSLRAKDAPRVGSIARSGGLWGLGSDAGIVAAYPPFMTLDWVVNGTNIGGQEGWDEDQRVSRQEALIAHTRNNAVLLFAEDDIGSLEVGKAADMVVLDRDYMTIPAEEIADIQPVMTLVNGAIMFQRD